MAEVETKLQNNKLVTNAEFTNISLEGDKPKKTKVPRKVLHFSDGILEEYSTDEEDVEPPKPSVDPKTLTWLPWMWHYVVVSAISTLGAADFCGEKLAWLFGITSPKYQHAIDEYYRLKEDEEKEKKRLKDKYQTENGAQLSSINVDQDSSLSAASVEKPGINKEEYEKY